MRMLLHFKTVRRSGFWLTEVLRDIWSALHPTDAGLTWPYFLEDTANPDVTPFQRIDLILTRGNGVEAESEQLVGTTPINGIWASDHAGVVATLKLLP